MAGQPQLLATLTKLGLKQSDALIYLATLEQGHATILTLTRVTGIKRGTVYEITNRLIDQGFIKVTQSGQKRVLIAQDPRIITAKYKENSDTLLIQLPQFLALQNANENKPKVTFYEGEDEVWEIYEDTLRTGQPILSYISALDVYQLLDAKKIDEYIVRRVAKKIPIQIIALESEASRMWAKKSKDEFREIRLIPKEQYNFSADMEIYGNKVAIVSFKEDVFGLIIESEQISQMYKSTFALMWQGAQK